MPEPAPRDWRKFASERLPHAPSEVQIELAQHLEQASAEALANGKTEPEAAAWAESRFADWRALSRDIANSKQNARPFTGMAGDLRQALRLFRTNPAFAALAVATLAFGIGANTAIFTMADALALRSLPYPQPERLMAIETTWPRQPEIVPWTSTLDFFDLRGRAQSFAAIAAVSPVWSDILTGAGPAERLETLYVSASFFPALGVSAELGRTFTADEDSGIQGKRVVVLSHELWERRFSARSDILGRAITLNGNPFTVIGVLPRGFRYLGSPVAGSSADIAAWMPLAVNQIVGTPRGVRFLKVIGRLKPSASPQSAAAEIRGIGQALKHEYPASNNDVAIDALPLGERIAGPHRATAFLLLGAVAFVLLMACANVASLLLVRAASRRKDVALRAALGASRYRILRQLLAEGLALAIAGGGAGWLVAFWGVRLLTAIAPPGLLPEALALDWRALGFTGVAVFVCAIAAAFPPAWSALNGNLNAGLRQASRGLTRGSHRLRAALVAFEAAAALALLAGAGLLIHSFARLLDVNPGFDAHNLLSITTQINLSKPEDRVVMYQRIRESLLAVPGVESVDAVSRLPLSGSDLGAAVLIEGRAPENGEGPSAQFRRATPGYFSTMRIPLRAGRLFDDHDGAAMVAVISESMQRRLWSGESAIGRRIKLGPDPAQTQWTTIVGVVGDVRHYALDAEAPAMVYVPYALSPLSSPILVIRTRAPATDLAPILASRIRGVDATLPAYDLYSMETLIERSGAQRRFVMSLLTAFAIAALMLAALGVFGAVSQSVAQRTREIGVRMALGSSPGEAVAMVFADGIRPALIGAVTGLALAVGLARLLRNLLFEVQPLDPFSFAGAVGVLLLFAALACYVPARRATRVDPLIALREE